MTSGEDVPDEVSAVVIGGGAMGCSTLYHLARAGVDAVLLERNAVGSGTTWHSAAQVRALRSDRSLTELVRYSIGLYQSLEAETGLATGWIGKGSLSIATTPDRLVHLRRQHALARAFGLGTEVLSPGEAGERWPLMRTDDVIGAVWSPEDGRVGGSDLCASLVRGARARGARVFENTPVTGLLTRSGRVAGVETAAGTIRTEAVVLCAGLWSRRVGAMAGVGVPLWPCEHFYLLTGPVEGLAGPVPTLSDHDGHLYIRDDSGGMLVGCFEPHARAIDPEILGENFAFGLLPEDWDHFEPMMHNALHRIPALADAGVRTLLNGPESFTPDGVFLLGEAAGTRGLWLGCGMNSVGVASSGGAGLALAEYVASGRPPFDLVATDPKRFGPEWNDARALAERIPEVLGRHYEISYPARQWSTARGLRRSPLDGEWQREGAVLHQHAGWERPAWFGAAPASLTFARPPWHETVAAEVGAASTGAALFDLSTYGMLRVEGPDARAFLDRVCANDMDCEPGRAVYTGMLNDRGGYESDLVVFRLGPDSYRLHVGTTALVRDTDRLHRFMDGRRVSLRDESAELGILGLMGPRARELAPGLDDIAPFAHRSTEVAGIPVRAARISYVGTPGWELTCRSADLAALYRALRSAGAVPAGLEAQSSMRIEMRHLAYGSDLDTATTPFEAGLGFTLAWETPFIGREALLRLRDQGPPIRRIASLVLESEDAVPLGDEPVFLDGRVVGRTTSAAFGHRVGRPVALAMIEERLARDGTRLVLDCAGREEPVTVRRGRALVS